MFPRRIARQIIISRTIVPKQFLFMAIALGQNCSPHNFHLGQLSSENYSVQKCICGCIFHHVWSAFIFLAIRHLWWIYFDINSFIFIKSFPWSCVSDSPQRRIADELLQNILNTFYVIVVNFWIHLWQSSVLISRRNIVCKFTNTIRYFSCNAFFGTILNF